MRKLLTFEAIPERPSGSVLLQLSVVLRQLDINPESLVWTAAPPDGTLRLRLRLSEHNEHWLDEIAERLRHASGVCQIRCTVTEESSPLHSETKSGSDHPFTD